MSTRSRLARPALALAGLTLLAACGSGQRAQTYEERTVADATNDAIGAIAVRDLAVLAPRTGISYPVGSDAPVDVTLVNDGGADDVLQSASSPSATSVDVVGPTPTLMVPRLGVANSSYGLVLRGLTEELRTGTYVELTLAFRDNGTKKLLVPVQTVPEQVARPSGTYDVPDTDSAGAPLVGDNVPDSEQEPKGDQAPQPTPVSE